MKNLYWIKGSVFSIFCSVIAALFFSSLAQTWAGGMTSFWGESWLYYSVLIPFAVTFTVLGIYFQSKKELSNKKLWLISLICAFTVTLYSGTIGAIFGEMIVRGGMKTINFEDTLVWSTIYAFILLPLTTPFARLLIEIFHKLMKKFKIN